MENQEIEFKIGDKLFTESNYHGIGLVTIERFTPTTAVISDGSKLKLPIKEYQSAIGVSGFGKTFYRLPTDELYEKLERQNLTRRMQKLDFSKLSTENLRKINSIITA